MYPILDFNSQSFLNLSCSRILGFFHHSHLKNYFCKLDLYFWTSRTVFSKICCEVHFFNVVKQVKSHWKRINVYNNLCRWILVVHWSNKNDPNRNKLWHLCSSTISKFNSVNLIVDLLIDCKMFCVYAESQILTW